MSELILKGTDLFMKKTGRISKITDMDLFACYNEAN